LNRGSAEDFQPDGFLTRIRSCPKMLTLTSFNEQD
jgi:hypothetical protein